MPLALAITLIIITSVIIWETTNKSQAIFLHLFLLAISPWILVLLLARPKLKEMPITQTKVEQIRENLAFITSTDFLFTRGDGRPGYRIGNQGLLLLSFFPLILTGTYQSLSAKGVKPKLALWWLGGGLLISIVKSSVVGLPASLWFVPALSLLATIGLLKLINLIQSPNAQVAVKTAVTLNLVWIMYEAAQLYHVIIVHQPFNY